MLTGRLAGRVGRLLVGLAVSLAVLAGISGVGVLTSMGEAFPAPPPIRQIGDGAPVRAAPSASEGRFTVAVVLGATGTVASDVLIPYEVFARSPRFSVYTVAATRDPVTLSGAVHVLPDRTFSEVGNPAEPPDVVVVPAVAEPAGGDEAPLRAWVTQQAGAGSQVLGVCAGSEVLAASGALDGRRATTHWARIGPLSRSYPDVDWVRGSGTSSPARSPPRVESPPPPAARCGSSSGSPDRTRLPASAPTSATRDGPSMVTRGSPIAATTSSTCRTG